MRDGHARAIGAVTTAAPILSPPDAESQTHPSDNPTHIKDLRPDKRNARKHNPRNIGMIERSLQEVGAARSIVIDEDNNILAGNGTIEAAGNIDITRLRIVDADGDEIIAVRRSGLTPEQKKKLAIADNRTAELAGWDAEASPSHSNDSPQWA